MKKVLVIVPFPMSEENLNFRREQLKAIPVSNNLSFTFRPVKAAPRNYVSQADMVLADIGVLETGLSAEKEGFSAVCVDTMSDSGVSALRSVLSIPVVGQGRTSMLTALSLGNKFSIVTMWQKWKHFYMKPLTELGVENALASVRAIDVAPDNQALLRWKEEEIFPMLESAALQAIEEDGAEIIVVGSTTMHQSHSYLSKKLNVPIINPGPLTYKKIELLLDTELTHSRKTYPISPVPRDQMIKAMLDAAAQYDH